MLALPDQREGRLFARGRTGRDTPEIAGQLSMPVFPTLQPLFLGAFYEPQTRKLPACHLATVECFHGAQTTVWEWREKRYPTGSHIFVRLWLARSGLMPASQRARFKAFFVSLVTKTLGYLKEDSFLYSSKRGKAWSGQQRQQPLSCAEIHPLKLLLSSVVFFQRACYSGTYVVSRTVLSARSVRRRQHRLRHVICCLFAPETVCSEHPEGAWGFVVHKLVSSSVNTHACCPIT